MQFVAILLMLLAGEPAALRPGDHSRSLAVDGRNRAYLVHVPPQYDPAAPMPMVLAFHGGGGNANNMVAFSGLNEKADQAGFIVVYPEGSGRLPRMLTFNAGNCCGKAAESKIDDVAFTRLVLDDLERIANVDRRRVFATGMRATPAGLGRQHARHLRQRHDVGVLPAAPDEMMLSGRRG
jgi:polyhydroxybutyrate depolymerase